MESFKIPIGFKFVPKDSELIGHYLANRILANSSQIPFIKDCNVFRDDLEIWDIWNRFGGDDDEELYLFSTQRRLSRSNSNFCRRIGSGTWAGENGGEKIETPDNVSGFKKRFRYETQDDRFSEYHGGWIMHLYSLTTPKPEPAEGDEVVLCRIKKNQAEIEDDGGFNEF